MGHSFHVEETPQEQRKCGEMQMGSGDKLTEEVN